jgi:hypothetical protein
MSDDFDLVIIENDGTEVRASDFVPRGELVATLSADQLAEKLAELVRVFAENLRDVVPADLGGEHSELHFADLTIGLAVSAEGNLGVVKGSATGSIALRFSRSGT